MPKKGKAKNTKNKAKHNKLLDQKNKKKKDAKELTKIRLKAIITKAKEQEKND